MIDVDQFKKILKHKKDQNGLIEAADCKAISFDDNDGLACSLGFLSEDISKVDYCVMDNEKVQLIELTDYKESIYQLKQDIKKEEAEAKKQGIKLNKKKYYKAKWKPIVTESQLKYQGSLAPIERLFSKNKIEGVPSCQLLIICKNNTDIIILDLLNRHLKTSLEGMIRHGVRICKTKDACGQLLSLN